MYLIPDPDLILNDEVHAAWWSESSFSHHHTRLFFLYSRQATMQRSLRLDRPC